MGDYKREGDTDSCNTVLTSRDLLPGWKNKEKRLKKKKKKEQERTCVISIASKDSVRALKLLYTQGDWFPSCFYL